MAKYFQEINENTYLTLVSTNESTEKIKNYEELWTKIRDLIRSVSKKSDDYDEKYMKTKLDSGNKLEIHVMVIVVRAFFIKMTNIIHKLS